MRWLLIVLLASLAALLFAAAGVARHIRRQRTRDSSESTTPFEPVEEHDVEVKR